MVYIVHVTTQRIVLLELSKAVSAVRAVLSAYPDDDALPPLEAEVLAIREAISASAVNTDALNLDLGPLERMTLDYARTATRNTQVSMVGAIRRAVQEVRLFSGEHGAVPAD